MSVVPCPDPAPGDAAGCAAVETVLVPRRRDIGGMEVGRVLPSAQGQMIGPFIFFDRMGPVRFGPHQAEDVLPHPHIGLATVTYLLDGTMTHRDSLGTAQVITPGAVNLMTAGRGIVHSERHDARVKSAGGTLSGVQIWLALPEAREDGPPDFVHAAADALPRVEDGGLSARVILGTAFGARSPVPVASPAVYVDACLAAGATLPLDAGHEERALFILEGEVEVDGTAFAEGRMLMIRNGLSTQARARTTARVLLLGGAALDGPRYIWWNFVSSRLERIAHAREAWRQGRFDLIPTDRDTFIPAPDDGPGRPRAQRPRGV
ncbi:pirin family protein [Xanthobacter agilis]|uniref:Redox-sensitive bicupin YhaK (Pirin superfamily) n=1 Tax=Xanthobacter agilis TaxID=47492 RepID=A0ABU0LFL1_XANAG|nr:pirin family protein [Xanthobacter agilis]MDQ0505927.1 redox-sensitive bicupin YhaK (pirin superfamily) [Xanthobacter agilis]